MPSWWPPSRSACASAFGGRGVNDGVGVIDGVGLIDGVVGPASRSAPAPEAGDGEWYSPSSCGVVDQDVVVAGCGDGKVQDSRVVDPIEAQSRSRTTTGGAADPDPQVVFCAGTSSPLVVILSSGPASHR